MGWDHRSFYGVDRLFYLYPHRHLGMILLILLLIIMASGAAARMTQERLRAREADRRDWLRDRIFCEIDAALAGALSANGVAMITKAEKLVEVYEKRLGALLRLSEAPCNKLEAVRKATAPGKIKEQPHGKAHHGEEHDTEHASQKVGVVVATGPVTVVNPTPAAHAPEHPHQPEQSERDMSLQEQLAAVRTALEDFSKAWHKPRVDELLRDAQTTLLDSGDKPYPGGGWFWG